MFGNLFIELLAMLGSLIVATLIIFMLAVFVLLLGGVVNAIKASIKDSKEDEYDE